jgi:hypothetical protein
MNTKQRMMAICSLVASVLAIIFVISGCGPGQLFGPTLTPTHIPTTSDVRGALVNAATNAPIVTVNHYDPKIVLQCNGQGGDKSNDYYGEGDLDSSGAFLFENVPPADYCILWFDSNGKRAALSNKDGEPINIAPKVGEVLDLGTIPVK